MLPLTKALMSISGKITGTKWEHGKLKKSLSYRTARKGWVFTVQCSLVSGIGKTFKFQIVKVLTCVIHQPKLDLSLPEPISVWYTFLIPTLSTPPLSFFKSIASCPSSLLRDAQHFFLAGVAVGRAVVRQLNNSRLEQTVRTTAQIERRARSGAECEQ